MKSMVCITCKKTLIVEDNDSFCSICGKELINERRARPPKQKCRKHDRISDDYTDTKRRSTTVADED